MSDGPTPAQLLAAAKVTLSNSSPWGGSWQRAVAFLARQALEDAIGEVWTGAAAGMAACPLAAQLTCLPYYLEDQALAFRARHCWYALSSACHAHPYELAPTLAELAGWLADVEALVSPTLS